MTEPAKKPRRRRLSPETVKKLMRLQSSLLDLRIGAQTTALLPKTASILQEAEIEIRNELSALLGSAR